MLLVTHHMITFSDLAHPPIAQCSCVTHHVVDTLKKTVATFNSRLKICPRARCQAKTESISSVTTAE